MRGRLNKRRCCIVRMSTAGGFGLHIQNWVTNFRVHKYITSLWYLSMYLYIYIYILKRVLYCLGRYKCINFWIYMNVHICAIDIYTLTCKDTYPYIHICDKSLKYLYFKWLFLVDDKMVIFVVLVVLFLFVLVFHLD